jgi:hypothetical protein
VVPSCTESQGTIAGITNAVSETCPLSMRRRRRDPLAPGVCDVCLLARFTTAWGTVGSGGLKRPGLDLRVEASIDAFIASVPEILDRGDVLGFRPEPRAFIALQGTGGSVRHSPEPTESPLAPQNASNALSCAATGFYGCVTVPATPAASRAPRLRRVSKTAKERDEPIRIPAFGRAFTAFCQQHGGCAGHTRTKSGTSSMHAAGPKRKISLARPPRACSPGVCRQSCDAGVLRFLIQDRKRF